jgi:hypothetical protein
MATNGNGDGDLTKDQEAVLASTRLDQLLLRGLKKVILEVTSVKTWIMAAIIILLFYGKIDPMWAIVGLMGLTGAKELDINQVVEIVKMKFGR